MNTRNRTFTTEGGQCVTVWNTRTVERCSVTGWTGLTRTTRTWCEVTTGQQAGKTVELETGCSFTAERTCREAGVR